MAGQQMLESMRQLPLHHVIAGTLVVGLVAANAKSLPLAHTLRLGPSLYRLLRARWECNSGKSARAPSLTRTPEPALGPPEMSPAARPALFKHYTMPSRAIVLDLDINMHKSNSTFFADADINRAELITTLLSQALASLASPAFVLAGVQCKFQREIRPYQSYVVSSRILTWTDKAMYVVTYFTKPGTKLARELDLLGGPDALAADAHMRKMLFATLVSKYVFKAGRATVPPAHVFQEARLLGEADSKDANEWMSREDVAATVQAGLRYIRQCME